MYESMNMNMNSRKRKSFETNLTSMQSIEKMMLEENVSPWSKEIFLELMKDKSPEQNGLSVMETWLMSVTRSYPSCVLVIPCLAAQEYVGGSSQQFSFSHLCPHKSTCPLFD